MPLALSKLQPLDPTRDVTLDFGEAGTLKMTIDPNNFTIGRQRAIKQAGRENDIPGMADALFSIVKGWDLVDDEGKTLPLDESGIDYLKTATVMNIFNKLTEALQAPKSETSNE